MSAPRCVTCGNFFVYCTCKKDAMSWRVRLDTAAEDDTTVYNVVLEGPEYAVLVSSHIDKTAAAVTAKNLIHGIIRGARP